MIHATHVDAESGRNCGSVSRGARIVPCVGTESFQCANGNLREFRSPNVFLSPWLYGVLAGRAARYRPLASTSWLAIDLTSCCLASAHQRRSDAIRPSRPWISPTSFRARIAPQRLARRSFCERPRSSGDGPARRVRIRGEAPDEKRRMRDLYVQRSDRRAGTSERTRRNRLLLTRFHGMRCCSELFVAGTQRRLRPRRQRARGHALNQRQFARERHCFDRPDDAHACADRSDRQMHRA